MENILVGYIKNVAKGLCQTKFLITFLKFNLMSQPVIRYINYLRHHLHSLQYVDNIIDSPPLSVHLFGQIVQGNLTLLRRRHLLGKPLHKLVTQEAQTLVLPRYLPGDGRVSGGASGPGGLDETAVARVVVVVDHQAVVLVHHEVVHVNVLIVLLLEKKSILTFLAIITGFFPNFQRCCSN